MRRADRKNRHISVQNPYHPGFNIKIDDCVFDKYPDAKVVFLIANVETENDMTELLSMTREKVANQLKSKGITEENYKTHPDYTKWMEAYKDFGVDNKKKRKVYKPSICALLDMYFQDKLNALYPMVDLYNLISIMHIMPMGAYDFNTIRGCDLTLRYGQGDEEFVPVGKSEPVEVLDSALCYAVDDIALYDHIATYMMNWKDSENFAVKQDSRQIIFFADQLTRNELSTPESAIAELRESLMSLGLGMLAEGVVNSDTRSLQVILPKELDIGRQTESPNKSGIFGKQNAANPQAVVTPDFVFTP